MNANGKIENVLYGGIDFDLPGNGGQACAEFLNVNRRVCESILAVAVSCTCLAYGYHNLVVPQQSKVIRKDRGGKRLLLIILCLVFGIEIGFKFATKSLIFLLNPCHVTTACQIYLLAAPPSSLVTKLFRVHINLLNGAILALLFPVTNTRLLPFETETYYIQHLLMLVVPYYLLRLGGVYTLEDYGDFSWSSLTYGYTLLYHFTILQFFGLATTVNLNSMICPAVSDPFYGPNYRLAAIIHQMLMTPLVSKGYRLVASYFLTSFSFTKVKDKLEADLALGVYRTSSISCVSNSNFNASNAAIKEEKMYSKSD